MTGDRPRTVSVANHSSYYCLNDERPLWVAESTNRRNELTESGSSENNRRAERLPDPEFIRTEKLSGSCKWERGLERIKSIVNLDYFTKRAG